MTGSTIGFADIVGRRSAGWEVETTGAGLTGRLPLTPEKLRDRPSGDIFGLTQSAGMGWDPAELGRPQYLILSTQGGVRAPNGQPIALGYHTGHWEIGLQVQAAAEELRALGAIPFAGQCSDPCDGRSQGTAGMMDSLPYRNDAADPAEGARLPTARAPRPDLSPDPELPDDTRLWALLQQMSGGTWGGCVYDANAVLAALPQLHGRPSDPSQGRTIPAPLACLFQRDRPRDRDPTGVPSGRARAPEGRRAFPVERE